MKKLNFSKKGLIRISIILVTAFIAYTSNAQYIQYRDKSKPVNQNKNVPEAQGASIPENKLKIIPVKTKTEVSETIAIKLNPTRKYIEEQYMCNLLSRPDVVPQLPIIINNVSPETVKKLKEKYEGRLYSITTLNMTDDRLKYKLKICDKDNGKFRSEYLDIDGNVINNPNLEY
jgi:hypothetical protein